MNRIAFAFVSLILSTAPVMAHSAFVRSDPKAGDTLKSSPSEIRVWFSEPIKVGLSTFEVRDAAGKQLDQRDLRADAKEPTMVHLSLAANLAPGIYKVSWSAVAQDLHVGKGGFRFTVAP
jgi:methionine-rich copper-binding protein CopC